MPALRGGLPSLQRLRETLPLRAPSAPLLRLVLVLLVVAEAAHGSPNAIRTRLQRAQSASASWTVCQSLPRAWLQLKWQQLLQQQLVLRLRLRLPVLEVPPQALPRAATLYRRKRQF